MIKIWDDMGYIWDLIFFIKTLDFFTKRIYIKDNGKGVSSVRVTPYNKVSP